MVKIPKFPKNETPSEEYRVKVNEKEINCYSARVSAFPFNQVWCGYQRPIEQTELTSFVVFSADEKVTLSVESEYENSNVKVRPISKNIVPDVRGKIVEIELPGAGQYVLEFGSRHRVLHIFVNPIKDFSQQIDENTICFSDGTFYLDEFLELKDNQSVFIDEDAIVYGAIKASNSKNIRVFGHGILDNSLVTREQCGKPMNFFRCRNVSVEGVTVRDASEWSMHFSGCDNCYVDNIKLIGMWRYNSDGCDFTNSVNCVLKNSFLRNFDDCIVIKGLADNPDKDLCNIYVENCITWCDWGKNIEIGAETCADRMSGMTFRNCDIIYMTHCPMDVAHGDRALVSDILFEDIRVEYENTYHKSDLQQFEGEQYKNEMTTDIPVLACVTTVHTMWSTDETTGELHNVKFKDIKAYTDGKMPGFWVGEIENRGVVKGITVENLVVNGKKITNCMEARVGTTTGVSPYKYVEFID